MKRGLVLGGGGLVGMAYHAGVLKALDEWGIDLAGSDVIVGTSAGSVMAAYLASGWTPSDFYDYAHGRHPDSEKDEASQRHEVRRLFDPLYANGAERARRAVGSIFAAAASRGYWHGVARERMPNAYLRRAFPSGMYSTDGTRERLERDLPKDWPRDGLYICAVDLYTGKRVPFGSRGAPRASLPEAVLASTAIPGVFPPVRIGERHYVDGGAVTATSLDLAVEGQCTAILCVAPLGYKREEGLIERDPRMWGPMLVRALFARALRREVRDARARGIDVFVVRPWLTDLRAHGTNSMRYFDRTALVDAARQGTLRLLDDNADHPVLASAKREGAWKER